MDWFNNSVRYSKTPALSYCTVIFTMMSLLIAVGGCQDSRSKSPSDQRGEVKVTSLWVFLLGRKYILEEPSRFLLRSQAMVTKENGEKTCKIFSFPNILWFFDIFQQWIQGSGFGAVAWVLGPVWLWKDNRTTASSYERYMERILAILFGTFFMGEVMSCLFMGVIFLL